jgi:hypothetical protein
MAFNLLILFKVFNVLIMNQQQVQSSNGKPNTASEIRRTAYEEVCRVIQCSSAILFEVVGEIIWSRKCK